YVISGSLIIALFVSLKGKTNKFDVEKETINYQKHEDWITFFIIGFGWQGGKSIFVGDILSLFTISGWCLAASITLLFFKNKKLSGFVESLIVPLFILVMSDLIKIMNNELTPSINVIINFPYHTFMIITGCYILFFRRDLEWDKLLIWGLAMRIFCIGANKFIYRYILDFGPIILMSFIDITVIAYIAYIVNIKNIKSKTKV
ncbi:MAG: hypothetical protein GY870_17545, partial [archaeon]|nr:hypothetical protein [archaeon]